MKRFPIFLSIICLIGLFACNNEGTGKATTAVGSSDTTVTRSPSGLIAYVHLDTLMQNYDMYLDLTSEFEAKAKKAEADVTSRRRSLERAAADAQEKYERGLVTTSEARQMQEDISRREQSYYAFAESTQMELAEENQVLTNKIFYSIDDFIKEFNSDYRYSLILTTSGGAPILHGDPMLDITSLVMRGLNEKYAREKRENKTE